MPKFLSRISFLYFIFLSLVLFFILASNPTPIYGANCSTPAGQDCALVNGTCQKNSPSGPFICYYQGMYCSDGVFACNAGEVNFNACVAGGYQSCTSYLSTPNVGVESFCCRIAAPTPVQPCNAGATCGSCTAPSNTCNSGNGSQTCTYNSYIANNTTSTNCTKTSFTQSCGTLINCSSGNVCDNGSCVAPTPPPICDYDLRPDGCPNNQWWCGGNNSTCAVCSPGFLNCDQTKGCEYQGTVCHSPSPTPTTVPTLPAGVTPTVTPTPTQTPTPIPGAPTNIK